MANQGMGEGLLDTCISLTKIIQGKDIVCVWQTYT